MTRTLNALVLGVGGNVSQSIQKALALASVPVRQVAACIDPSSAGLYVADRSYISPLARSAEFLPWLVEVCQREAIDVVMSGSEIVLEALAPQKAMLHSRTGAMAVVSSPEVLETGRDKLRSCRWLEQQGLPAPGYADLSDASAVAELVTRYGFPLVAKPRFGKGSDGVMILRDEQDLERVLGAENLALREIVGGSIEPREVIIQEHLGSEDQEYTAGCFCDRNGEVRATIVLRRRLQAGTTVRAEPGSYPEVASAAEAVAAALGAMGPCNVQLRSRGGTGVAFDINPRFSGTTAVRARLGFNEVEAVLRHFALGEDVPRLVAGAEVVALRYWNEMYVPAQALSRIGEQRELESWAAPRVEDWGAQDGGKCSD